MRDYFIYTNVTHTNMLGTCDAAFYSFRVRFACNNRHLIQKMLRDEEKVWSHLQVPGNFLRKIDFHRLQMVQIDDCSRKSTIISLITERNKTVNCLKLSCCFFFSVGVNYFSPTITTVSNILDSSKRLLKNS